MKKWECTVCSYIHEGDSPPDECPVCGADKSAFVELTEEQTASTQDAQATAPESAAQASEEKEAPSPLVAQSSSESSVSLWKSFFAKSTELILKHHLHPIAVHTPNGVLPMAFIFLLIAALLSSQSFDLAALYSFIFVLISMPLVIFTGYGAWKSRYRGAMTSIFRIKIACSVIMLFCLAILVLWRLLDKHLVLMSPSRWLYLLFALIALIAAAVAGHLGGKLIMGSRNK